MKRRIHIISFKHAWDGIVYSFLSQPNFQVHAFFTLLVVCAGRYFSIGSGEWIVLIFTIAMVFVAEMVNTSIECMTDLLTPDYHIAAKRAKDVSAGMVLVTAIFAVIIGAVIFLPYLGIFFM